MLRLATRQLAQAAGPQWAVASRLCTRSLSYVVAEDHIETQSKIQRHIHVQIESIYDDVFAPIASRLQFPSHDIEQASDMPMVLILGNHSSGKSSFINHLLGKDIQKTGVATTDDGFTILAGGTVEEDRDGPALVLSPEWGFGSLERLFGRTLVSHVQLKVRRDIALLDRMVLVDTPGMIDAPASQSGPVKEDGYRTIMNKYDRGYDFKGTVRWFAERADVILLLFDPDKPGTTGETLDVLTSCLSDLDHKVLIIMNKVDQFHQVEDFARAYGSLCWNLSKVIPRKDLPRIYTMFLPVQTFHEKNNLGEIPMSNFDAARLEVIEEVWKSPKRRIDNQITELHDTARRLRMYSMIAEEARKEYSTERWRWISFSGALFSLGQLGAAATLLHSGTWDVVAALSVGGIFGGASSWIMATNVLSRRKTAILDGLTSFFERLYVREIAEQNQEILSLWSRMRGHMRTSLEVVGLENIPRLKSKEISSIDKVLNKLVPELRREVHTGFLNKGIVFKAPSSPAPRAEKHKEKPKEQEKVQEEKDE